MCVRVLVCMSLSQSGELLRTLPCHVYMCFPRSGSGFEAIYIFLLYVGSIELTTVALVRTDWTEQGAVGEEA